ncbi:MULTISPECIES: cell wall hydrolase [Shouchella]|uniref:Cell wall hydrolase n=2 Tax=Shouchella TaxID=2893057 RepID=A0ABY7W870_9BACI|nr:MULTISPECIES: cell wall hydrolase [Shouchella]MED4127594.1 cell wall hydrolase [Shouchella miscanthi]WDF04032.1 cell wall hydrolase [Shouchella hunanensis]
MFKKITLSFVAFFGISLFSSASIDGKTIKHPVQAGESLYTISERYGVSQASIQRINQLQTNQLEAGTTLTIPTAITASDREWMAKLVYAEAKGESYEGKVAVATVLLNRLDHQDYPDTMYDVIHQVTPSGHYAFSPVLDGAIHNDADEESRRAVNEAIAYRGLGQQSLYFYNPATATSGWVATREQTIVIGNHVFAK